MAQASLGGENSEGDQKNWEADEASAENSHQRDIEAKTLDHQNKMDQIKATGSQKKAVKKSLMKSKPLRIEYYRLEK
jgi:hypothetical protein